MRYTKQLIELQNIKSNNCKSTVVRFTTLETHMKIHSTEKLLPIPKNNLTKYIRILLHKQIQDKNYKSKGKKKTRLS